VNEKFPSIILAIGNTPLVRINKLAACGAAVRV
jgi:hypothetical protein